MFIFFSFPFLYNACSMEFRQESVAPTSPQYSTLSSASQMEPSSPSYGYGSMKIIFEKVTDHQGWKFIRKIYSFNTQIQLWRSMYNSILIRLFSMRILFFKFESLNDTFSLSSQNNSHLIQLKHVSHVHFCRIWIGYRNFWYTMYSVLFELMHWSQHHKNSLISWIIEFDSYWTTLIISSFIDFSEIVIKKLLCTYNLNGRF